MRIIALFISVLILVAVSCATTQSGGGATAQTGGRSGQTAGQGQSAGQAPRQRDSFKIKELVFFADGAANGMLDEYIVFEWDPSFTNVVKETRYSASDSVLEKIEYGYQGNNPATKITKKIVADDKGKEQEQVQTQVEYQYERDRLQKETLKSAAGVIGSYYEYTYDAQGNRASRIWKNGKDAVMAETVYSYANGRLASAETKSAGGNRISSVAYQYDEQGKLVKQETRGADGKISSVLTAVWQNGLEAKHELIGADNTPQQRETNEYNPAGDLVKKTIENVQGKSTRIIQYEYTGKTSGR
ncbi:MAG: hypothetical protein LBD48_10435 [Treponema sp.]|jgi:hypothetical protein|nr:hypothetical protein [Treponema sp.]